MMHQGTLLLATWVLSRLAPEAEREPIVGDLMEEYALRANRISSTAALKWYLQQVYASAPSLLWARIRRTPWFSTIGVAFLAYIGVGVVDFGVKWFIPNWTPEGGFAPNPLGLIVTFPMIVLIGYFAARFRPGAAILLGLITLAVITWMTWGTNESMPLWFRLGYFVVGPVGAFLGGALHSLHKDRSARR
jgi:hypothetical protein